MVICRKCGKNNWKIFKAKEESSNAVCLKCVECENEEYAFCSSGRILVSSKSTVGHHSFTPVKCPSPLCGGNKWEVLQDEMICGVCNGKFPLDEGIEVSKKTRPPKKVGDYYGKKSK